MKTLRIQYESNHLTLRMNANAGQVALVTHTRSDDAQLIQKMLY